MGKTLSLEGKNLTWARARFAEYYRTNVVKPPVRLARREFASFPFVAATMMRRHESFRSSSEFQNFLIQEAPRHVYYSSAYYRIPDAPNMTAKEWLGADLIFDLDSDHLRQAKGLDYAAQLDLVKEKVRDLWDDFLIGDFGVDPAQTHLVFSGGRGYHVHVQDLRFLGLTSPERRELVDYVLGLGFDPASAIRETMDSELGSVAVVDTGAEEAGGDGRRRIRPRLRAFKTLHPPDTPGWRGRVTRALLRLLTRWESEGAEKAQSELEAFGVPRPQAHRLARLLVTRGRGRQIREGLSLDVFRNEVPRDLLETVLQFAAVELQGETDAPVTTDIHRLIRLPSSLHGGTGFRVEPLPREALDRFNPLRDALVPASDGDRVEVEMLDTVDYPFPDGRAGGREGQRKELPSPVALFFILRGQAALPS